MYGGRHTNGKIRGNGLKSSIGKHLDFPGTCHFHLKPNWIRGLATLIVIESYSKAGGISLDPGP